MRVLDLITQSSGLNSKSASENASRLRDQHLTGHYSKLIMTSKADIQFSFKIDTLNCTMRNKILLNYMKSLLQ